MTSAPSTHAEDLFDDDEEEVHPANLGGSLPPTPKASPGKALPPGNRRGRPVFKIINEKGDGLYRCGNCHYLTTPWRRNAENMGPKKSCTDFGITADSRPCSFSRTDPLRRFNPITFGEVGISENMSVADIQLTRILLNRREEQLLVAASMPFVIGDKVQCIYQNKYTTGFVESFNRHYVYIKILNSNNAEHIIPMTIGSVTKA